MENGLLINKMEKVKKFGQARQDTLANMWTERSTVMENSTGQITQVIRGVLSITR